MAKAQLIDGKALAAKIRARLKDQATELKAKRGITPGLAVIRVGEDPASAIYVGGKRKAAAEIGFNSWEHHFPESAKFEEVLQRIDQINRDPAVHGVLVQLPLPKQMDPDTAIASVKPEKDADGFHPLNAGNLFLGRKTTLPCTPAGIMEMLKEIGCNPKGKRAVVVGRSNIVGKP
ncbi:MAG: bifunctional 5,10-methylenetetrahydrofolate dehydrogenase/5,10-methenyltetrahydrofolate cyclohydrolase, partial [Myxococcaceae bacterium]